MAPNGYQARVYQLESTLEAIDEAETLVADNAQEAGLAQDDIDALGMAIRECVANAVIHGNQQNQDKKVHLSISRQGDQLEILIGDEGTGFSLEDVPDPLADENLMKRSGRGILLIRSFVDEFEVRKREPMGTEVRLVKNLLPQ